MYQTGDETRSNIIFRWAGSAFLCPFSSVSCMLCFLLWWFQLMQKCRAGPLQQNGQKRRARPLQLNRQRNAEPAYLNMILDLVSASLIGGYIIAGIFTCDYLNHSWYFPILFLPAIWESLIVCMQLWGIIFGMNLVYSKFHQSIKQLLHISSELPHIHFSYVDHTRIHTHFCDVRLTTPEPLSAQRVQSLTSNRKAWFR